MSEKDHGEAVYGPTYVQTPHVAPSGDRVDFRGESTHGQADAVVPPQTRFGLSFFSIGEPIDLWIRAIPAASTASIMREDSDVLPDEPDDRHEVSETHAKVRVELHATDETLVGVWNLPEEEVVGAAFRFLRWSEADLGRPVHGASMVRRGWWRCVVTGTGPYPIKLHLRAETTVGSAPIRTRAIPKRLLNRTFRLALDVLTPDVRLQGSEASISLGREIANMYGLEPLRLTKDISGTFEGVELRSATIEAVSRDEAKTAAEQLDQDTLNFAGGDKKNLRYKKVHGRVVDFKDAVEAGGITLRIRLLFQEGSITFYGLDAAEIGALGELYLSFNHELDNVHPLMTKNPVVYTALGEIAEGFSLTPFNDEDVPGLVENVFIEHADVISTYVREVLGRAVGKRGVAIEGRATADEWRVKYFEDLEHPSPSDGGTRDLGEGLPDSWGAGGGVTPEGLPPVVSPDGEPRGTWPDEFIVAGGAALTRLDKIKTIVFIMMENRSFDHLLGDLPRARPRPDRPIDGLPLDATNPPAGGLLEPIRVIRAGDLKLGTAIQVCPNHHYGPVQFQIGGGDDATRSSGAMQGFTRDVARLSDSPQIAMTYYTENELPTYYRLADEFMVCDRWFCAHPGPTFPNRWATLLGSIPSLENIDVNDERFGFLEGRTIFELLDQYEIDWRLFESDVSMIRMFDRFRLDDSKVCWIDDEHDGLEATLDRGVLPSVIFIDPNFVDLPPMWAANDDHPPGDLAKGQEFIAKVCNALWRSRHWQDMLLVISYDEHGGWYDHVPPPGTPLGAPEWIGRIPPLHPEGPTWLGPRVPTFIVSPYVSAGAVTHEVFDHLAIIKTILVRHRSKFHQRVFTSFGPRVSQSPHLGVALDLDEARPPPLPFADRPRRPRRFVSPSIARSGRVVGPEGTARSPDAPMTATTTTTTTVTTREATTTTTTTTTTTSRAGGPPYPSGAEPPPSSRGIPRGTIQPSIRREVVGGSEGGGEELHELSAALKNLLKPKPPKP